MPHILLEKIFNIQGRNIKCWVTGEPGSENDARPFILNLQGGPGYGSRTSLSMADKFAKLDQGKLLLHWIFFDYVGCGESDAPFN